MARKSVVKRIRLTKTGKLMRRTMGQGHCRAKKRGVQLHRKRGAHAILGVDAKQMLRNLTNKN